jgi:hypothetical protein
VELANAVGERSGAELPRAARVSPNRRKTRSVTPDRRKRRRPRQTGGGGGVLRQMGEEAA